MQNGDMGETPEAILEALARLDVDALKRPEVQGTLSQLESNDEMRSDVRNAARNLQFMVRAGRVCK